MSLPDNFDWKHYIALNLYHVTATNEIEAKQHYLSVGRKMNLPYNFGEIETIIYSGGKTGGSTLFNSFGNVLSPLFAKSRCNEHLLHIHWDGALRQGFKISDIINCPRKKKLLMITSFREPIARYISAFFQNISYHVGKPFDEILKMDVNALMSEFIRKIRPGFIGERIHPFLENDKKNMDNVNIYRKPFDKNKKFQIYETHKVKIIMLLFDNINNWEKIIQENTEYLNFKLLPANLTSEKVIYNLYSNFCKQIVIPHDILDEIFSIEKDNLEYFYTQNEIDQIKKKWYRPNICL